MHGMPRRLESDNGPRFNSRDFEEFSKQEGFYHHHVTPEHARTNDEVASFMKMLNKTEQITHLQGRDTKLAVQEMLTGYRLTPHPATGIPPYKALMNRQVSTKLDHKENNNDKMNDEKMIINKRDQEYKEKLEQNSENRNTKAHNLIIGDYVLLKQKKRNKWSTAYKRATFYRVYRNEESSISARHVADG